MPIDLRERRLTILYCIGTILFTIIWWIGVMTTEWVPAFTLGSAFEPQGTRLLLLADLFAAVLLPLAILFALSKQPFLMPALLWVHFGCQVYAFCVSLVGGIIDPRACFGVFAMLLSAGCAFLFAVRASKLPILWGPFRFVDAPREDVRKLISRTLIQSLAMWAVFFGVLPAFLVLAERILGWRGLPPLQPVSILFACLFFLFGSVAIWSGIEMARAGDGTPLPSVGTRRLVVSGPYKYIRNPMAFLAVAQGACLGFMCSSILVIVYSVLGGIAWEVLVRPLEEDFLLAKFGGEYEVYRSRVWCWIPQIPGYRIIDKS